MSAQQVPSKECGNSLGRYVTQEVREAAERSTSHLIRDGYKLTAIYPYAGSDEEAKFFRLRYDHPETGAKEIRPMHKNDSGWQLGLPSLEKVPLYRLPDIVANPGAFVWVVEGERCADSLAAYGLVGITSGSSSSAGKADWKPLTGRHIVIWRDNDSTGLKYQDAVMAELLELGCHVEAIKVETLGLPEGGDIVDWLEVNPNASADDIQGLPSIELKLDDEVVIATLAKLPPVEYDRCREKEAERLGIRVSTLDKEVREKRSMPESDFETALAFMEEPEAWPEPVDGLSLFTDLCEMFARYLALPTWAAETLALWVLHTWTHEAAWASPILAVTSPQKRCGKSTLLGLLNHMVCKPLSASNITPAALFRSIEKWGPTLLIDEADTFLRTNEELRGILNSGHTRSTAFVIRTVGDNHEPTQFNTWAPKAIAAIGDLPSTLADRSIEVRMRRRLPGEQVERLRSDRIDGLSDLKHRCARWAEDNLERLKAIEPKVPTSLNDRAADNWRTLLATAEAIGGDVPANASSAASAADQEQEDETAGVLLLEDIKSFFEDEESDKLASSEIVSRLETMEERPWPEWKNGKPITARQVARLLKPFSIAPKSIRVGNRTPKGYEKRNFKDAFARYIPAQSATVATTLNNNELTEFQSATKELCVAHEINDILNDNNSVADVADETMSIEKEVMQWPKVQKEIFNERAAKYEYGAGMPQTKAEQRAYEELLGHVQ